MSSPRTSRAASRVGVGAARRQGAAGARAGGAGKAPGFSRRRGLAVRVAAAAAGKRRGPRAGLERGSGVQATLVVEEVRLGAAGADPGGTRGGGARKVSPAVAALLQAGRRCRGAALDDWSDDDDV